MAILMVNGTFNYKNRLWLELSIGNIIRYTSPYTDFKIFLWNHDYKNPRVFDYLASVKDHVEAISQESFDLSKWTGFRHKIPPPNMNYFTGGFHVHRAPLQILYEFATRKYHPEIFFTFDSDAWPIRNNWEIPLVFRLERDIALTGIWRDELYMVRPPHIHPSCLGIKNDTIIRMNLRFDYEPTPVEEDTLTHFTPVILDHFPRHAILPLKRSNAKEYHPVFSGIYGGTLYHHHLGSRYQEGKNTRIITAGWQERNESVENNKFLMDAAIAQIFNHTDDFILDLAYGDDAFFFKLYSSYLSNCYIDDAYDRLFERARKTRKKNLLEAYYISVLISKYFAFNKEFLLFYADLCEEMNYDNEAESYYNLAKSEKNPNIERRSY